MASKIDVEIKKKIIDFYNKGIKQKEIATIIKNEYGIDISQQAISYILKTAKQEILKLDYDIQTISNEDIQAKIFVAIKDLMEKLPVFINARNYPEVLRTLVDAYLKIKELENIKITNQNLVGIKIEFTNKNEGNNDDGKDNKNS